MRKELILTVFFLTFTGIFTNVGLLLGEQVLKNIHWQNPSDLKANRVCVSEGSFGNSHAYLPGNEDRLALSGTYTIGGLGSDYAGISDALADLSLVGVSGPVVFNVVPNTGPFIGGLEFVNYAGVSATNTITFNGNGNTINESAATFILAFNGASFITIDSFRIVNTQPALNKFGIMVRGASQHLSIINNYIDVGMQSTSSTCGGIAISSSTTSGNMAGNNGRHLNIVNNEIVGGYYGVSMAGQASYQNCFHIVIANNIIRDFFYYGIYGINSDTILISENDIMRPTRTSIQSLYGIYLNTTRNTKITKNKIHTTGAGAYTAYGIYLNTSVNSPGYETEIYNNAIYDIPTTQAITGIYILGPSSSHINLVYNTIHLIANGNGTARCLYASSNINLLNLFNNVFSIRGIGTSTKQCVYLNSSNTFFYSGNNNYYMGATAGSNAIGYWGSAKLTLQDWQLATGQDLNSFDVDPYFYADNDFRISSTVIQNAGIPIPYIEDDIFGTLRDTMAPSLGAFEYSLPSYDAGILSMLSPTSSCEGWQDVILRIKNYGAQAFSGISAGWIINDSLQNPYIDTLTFQPGEERDITIAAFNFVDGMTYDFVFYVSHPGGHLDQNHSNDTLSVMGYQTALSGTLTIGPGVSDDFPDLHAAVDEIHLRGICGPVVVKLMPNSGPYIGGILLSEVQGLSALSTLTFQGSNNVLNQGSENYIFCINNSSHIIIDSFQIINTTPSISKYGIYIVDSSDAIVVSNNLIDMGMGPSTISSTGIFVTGSLLTSAPSGSAGSNISIINNQILGGYYGINIQSALQHPPSAGCIIQNNIVHNFSSYGLRLNNVEDMIIRNNNIGRPLRNVATAFYGIRMQNGRNVKIVNNSIHSSGNSSNSVYAIHIDYSLCQSGQETELINNLVYNLEASSAIYAFSFNSNENLKINHNTIHLTSSGTIPIRVLYFSSPAHGHEVKNNILSITGQGTGTKYFIYATPDLINPDIQSDYNIFYTDVTTGNNYFGYYWSTSYASIQDWRFHTSCDTNSLMGNPLFAKPEIGNLRPISPIIDNKGTPLGVLDDYYGNTRSLTSPDPGAIEFTGLSSDLALDEGILINSECLNADDTLSFVITNLFGGTVDFAADPLSIHWTVTGPVNSSGIVMVYQDSILVDSSMRITRTGANLSLPGMYSLNAFLAPNAKNLFNGNDTLHHTYRHVINPPFEVQTNYYQITHPNQQISLTAKSPYFPPGPVIITEICHSRTPPGEPIGGWPAYIIAQNYIELTGVPYAQLQGYTLEQWDQATIKSTHTFGKEVRLGPSGTAIVAVGNMGTSVESPLDYYFHGTEGINLYYSNSTVVGRIIKDPAGNILDAVGFGNYSFPLNCGVGPSQWTGYTPYGGGSGVRLEGPYTHSATNWIHSSVSPQDPNELNANVLLPSPDSIPGLIWKCQGVILDSNVMTYTLGYQSVNGLFDYVASYASPCGLFTDTVQVEVALMAMLSDTSICMGDSAEISIYISGNPPWTLILSDGLTKDTISGLMSLPYQFVVSPLLTTTYSVYSFWDSMQVEAFTDLEVTITVNPLPVVDLKVYDTICITHAPFYLTGGTPPGGTYSGPGVFDNIMYPFHSGLGVHILSYFFQDSITGCSSSATDSLLVDQCLTIEEAALESGFLIFPNPGKGKIYIVSETDWQAIGLIEIADLSGKRVFSIDHGGSVFSCELNVGDLPKGLYFISLHGHHGVFRQKLIIQ